MRQIVKFAREASLFLQAFVGAPAELIVDTTTNRIRVQDGATPGGFPTARLDDLAGYVKVSDLAGLLGLTGISRADIPTTTFPVVQARFTTMNCAQWIRGAAGGPMATADRAGQYWVIDVANMGFVDLRHFEVDSTGATDCAAAMDAAHAAGVTFGVKVKWGPGSFNRSTPLLLTPSNMLDVDYHAVLGPFGTSPPSIGIRLMPGNYQSLTGMRLPSCGGYSDCCIELSSANLVKMVVAYIAHAETGARMVPSAVGGSILDSTLEINSIASTIHATVIKGLGGKDTIQGNVFKVNFITDSVKSATFQGYVCSCDGNRFDFEAVDITVNRSGGAWLVNEMIADPVNPSGNGTSVPRVTFNIRTWAGGDAFKATSAGGPAVPAQVIIGAFSGLSFDIRLTRAILPINYTDNVSNITGASLKFNFYGSSNSPFVMSNSQGLANFNGGVPTYLDSFNSTFTTTADLAPGAIVDIYSYVLFPDHFANCWQVSKINNLSALDIRGVVDESASVPYQIRTRIVNNSLATVPAGTVFNTRHTRKM